MKPMSYNDVTDDEKNETCESYTNTNRTINA